MKFASHWSHGKATPCFICFWLDSKSGATEGLEVAFLARNSFLRLAFLLRVDGLLLFLIIGRISLPSLVSKEKVKVEPIAIES